jgi:hypothetical protein
MTVRVEYAEDIEGDRDQVVTLFWNPAIKSRDEARLAAPGSAPS